MLLDFKLRYLERKWLEWQIKKLLNSNGYKNSYLIKS